LFFPLFILTETVERFGGGAFLNIKASTIFCAKSSILSSGKRVKSGESHRFLESGSSKRVIKFSNLFPY